MDFVLKFIISLQTNFQIFLKNLFFAKNRFQGNSAFFHKICFSFSHLINIRIVIDINLIQSKTISLKESIRFVNFLSSLTSFPDDFNYLLNLCLTNEISIISHFKNYYNIKKHKFKMPMFKKYQKMVVKTKII